MKRATSIAGETYCAEHQGNHSHYDSHNCTVCVLLAALRSAAAFIGTTSEYKIGHTGAHAVVNEATAAIAKAVSS